jgi:wyosine [tRNA(Phe)-imidazoG37] synthetase (radical SAM superfamily)
VGSAGYSFGPVPSRRLGRSLGINNIPAKVCSYACLYCQAGRTTRMQADRTYFYRPETIVQNVRKRLQRAGAGNDRVDYLTFVPNGEPTLDVNLGVEIVRLKETAVPVAVITNGSLLWRDDVREELSRADWVSLKIDAVQRTIWRTINRPHKAVDLSDVLTGMRRFASTFAGTLVTETMLVRGVNDRDDCLQDTADFIHLLKPARAYVSIPTRPPARKQVRGPTETALAHAHEIFAGVVGQVEYLIGYEGNAFSATGDAARDLLAIAAVHPMRAEAVDSLLTRAGASWKVVERLVAGGDLTTVKFGDHLYYVRRLP